MSCMQWYWIECARRAIVNVGVIAGRRVPVLVFLGGLILGVAPAFADGLAEEEAFRKDLDLLTGDLNRIDHDLDSLMALYLDLRDKMDKIFDCLPTYYNVESVIRGKPDKAVQFLINIDYIEFDIVVRHCAFPHFSLMAKRRPSGNRHYIIGKVNGVETLFLIDTGAFSIGFGQEHVTTLGLKLGERIRITTASGETEAYETKIHRLDLGPRGLKLRDLEAFVIKGQIGVALLGKTVLGEYVDIHTVESYMFLQSRQLRRHGRFISRTFRAMLFIFHVLYNECGDVALAKEEMLRCFRIDPNSAESIKSAKARIEKRYFFVKAALNLD